ncbi:hypothetical protein [Sphingomonas abietis]|uniref:Uncharacterized protein n=1 Tax=Sphingomonas abietis TaxID=3012344 RepID=A0ABY7NQH0_9SPHN|nr:hypothetical protein [Sphingomonas abietis]WBO23768.1 hypothetical protein PBT88_06495 [Sphingomonas abietis]
MRSLIFAALMSAAIPAIAMPAIAQAETRAPKSLLAMSPDAFRTATTVKDDPLEFHATLSTEKAHREGWKILSPYGHDNHLRAIVDKQSGAVRYEVRQSLRYWGTQRDYRTAHYMTDQGLRQVALSEARHGQDVCPTTENNLECPLSKTMAFGVDEAVLRAVAARYQPGAGDGLAFRLKDATGHDISSGIVPAEAAGLLQAVDRYRSGLTLS